MRFRGPAQPSPGHRARMWTSQYWIPALSHSRCVSWVSSAGSMDLAGKQRKIRIESNRGDFECYTKVPRWFFLSHGKQLTIGSSGDLNALGWLVWVWDAGETPQCAPQMHREAGTQPGDTDLGSIWTVVSFEGVNDDGPTLGEKLTIKAHEAKRKPVKDRKMYQRCGWRNNTSRVEEGAETGHVAQWSVCKSNPVVFWWWWFWLF